MIVQVGIDIHSEDGIKADQWIKSTINACLNYLNLSEAQVASILSMRLSKLLWKGVVE